MERSRNYYQQVDSNMMDIEINTHGKPLVIMSAHIPRDDVHEDSRFNVWEKLSDRANQIYPSKHIFNLGDFNAQLHAQKEGEEQHIGPHIFGRGAKFLHPHPAGR
eukprot:16443217-Heterocapsa_arctica.AAC.1